LAKLSGHAALRAVYHKEERRIMTDQEERYTNGAYVWKLVKKKKKKDNWVIFRLDKYGVKEMTNNFFGTEQEARKVADHWLKLDTDRAIASARRAEAKANKLVRLAELAGIGPEPKAAKKYDYGELGPYVWDVTEGDRIHAHALGVQLNGASPTSTDPSATQHSQSNKEKGAP